MADRSRDRFRRRERPDSRAPEDRLRMAREEFDRRQRGPDNAIKAMENLIRQELRKLQGSIDKKQKQFEKVRKEQRAKRRVDSKRQAIKAGNRTRKGAEADPFASSRKSRLQGAFSAIRGGQAFARGIRGESLIAGVGVARRLVSGGAGNIKNLVEAALFSANLADRFISQILRNEDFIAEAALRIARGLVDNVTFQRSVQVLVTQETERFAQFILSRAFINDIAARLGEEESFQREAAKVAGKEFENTERFRRIQARSAQDASREGR